MSLATTYAIAAMDIAPRFSRLALSPNDRMPVGSGLGSAHRGDLAHNYGTYRVRHAREEFLRALAANTAYVDQLYHGADTLRHQFKTSPTIRPAFNPFWRLSEFWATHLFSEEPKPVKPDGKSEAQAVAPALSKLLTDSKWGEFHSTFSRLGATLGTVFLFSVNDPLHRRTYLEVVDPSSVIEFRADALGEGRYYLYREWRDDPRPEYTDGTGMPRRVLYLEEGEVIPGPDGRPDRCRFRTYLSDGSYPLPWAWDEGQGVEWTEDYPFLPLVAVAHTRIIPGCPFGQAEGMPAVVKMIEHDDIASRFHAQVRKAVDAPWLFSGVKLDATLTTTSGDDALSALYSPDPAARAQALITSLDLSHVGGHLDRLKAEIEEDYPELQKAIKNATGDASGTALRVYQQALETKGQSRRAGYDAGLVHAATRCLRMGGMMGYDGYEDFTPEAIASDPERLNFRLQDRPLFRLAKIDALAVESAFWANAESADRAGIPIEAFLTLEGWTPERIKVVMDAQEAAMAKGLPVGRSKVQASPPNDAAAMAIQSPGGAAP